MCSVRKRLPQKLSAKASRRIAETAISWFQIEKMKDHVWYMYAMYVYMHSQNIRSGCRRPIPESADILPCEPLAQHTAVTSQDHWNCNDNYLNVNSRNDKRSYSLTLFMSWFRWIISQNEKLYSRIQPGCALFATHCRFPSLCILHIKACVLYMKTSN